VLSNGILNQAATGAEDLFVEIFQDAVGIDMVSHLIPNYPVQDIYQDARYIDFALIARTTRYAFEVDGEFWHRPDSGMVSSNKFRDDLLRQNSLVHLGWKVYRWTDGQLAQERENVIRQIRLFLEDELRETAFDGHLPLQDGEHFALHEHQCDALAYLSELRAQRKTIALLTHATGAGKTLTAICDAKAVGKRVLYLVHRSTLVTQTADQFRQFWPEVDCDVYRGGRSKPDTFVVVATYQGVGRNLKAFHPAEFGYLIADEAHHVPAPTFKKTFEYFKPDFTLGLTATDQRTDNQSLLTLFRECAPRLGLREAIEKGLLAPIRCVRVKTNIDLNRLRFNGNDYRLRDLEQGITIPERDRLIVATYMRHVPQKSGVTFCVSVAHAEHLASLFKAAGIPTEAISGRMSPSQRDEILERYASGKLQMLCACDLLNEGWDSPRTEVLMMARPTMSRVLYIQQLGRGTRLAPGKDCLHVFDFIDNTTRYAQAVNTHRLFGIRKYAPGVLVAAPPHELAHEQMELDVGKSPAEIEFLGLYVDRFEEIDIFDWKTEVADMLTVGELEIRLGVGGGTALNWVRNGKLTADHKIEIGMRTYHYFDKSRVENIRRQFRIPRRTAATRKKDFLQFATEMDMAASYKPVMLLALLDSVDTEGRCRLADLVNKFRDFYIERDRQGLQVERGQIRMGKVATLSDDEIEQLVLMMPFEKFERRKFLRRERDAAFVRFDRHLWKSLDEDDIRTIRDMADDAIRRYYERDTDK